MNRILLYFFATLTALIFLSCEKEKSTIIDPNLTVPYILSGTSKEFLLNLDTTTSSSVIRLANGQFTITDSINVIVSDANGYQALKQVSYLIYPPGSTHQIAQGYLIRSEIITTGPGSPVARYSANLSFTINRSEVGIYRIEIYAEDQTNQISNSLQLPLTITRNNSKPQTSNIVAPDSIVRPVHGFKLLFFSVAVRDSDGYGDIDQVFFKRISPSERPPIQLYDDGGKEPTSGDQLAGDGIFSRVVRIDSSAFLGSQVFLFLAKDRFGAFSDSLTHTITISE